MRRDSITGNNTAGVIGALRKAIREAEYRKKKNKDVVLGVPGGVYLNNAITINVDQDSYVVFQTEQILVDRKVKTVRKVYVENNRYKIGWVVDCDLNVCMICTKEFGWMRLKHHCRACGCLICSKCGPYTAKISGVDEEVESRVCLNCFGLRADFVPNNSSPNKLDVPIPTGIVKRRSNAINKAKVTLPIDALMINDIDLYEKLQQPLYEESYRKMRELIPVDIYKSNLNRLLDQGLPDSIANRVWNNKILWLIVMHPEDIAKIHLADFRGKYSLPSDLDIIELRAIWFSLPLWNVDGNSTNSLEKGKSEWKNGLKSRLDDYNYKEAKGSLSEKLARNEAYRGHEDLQLFDSLAELKTRFDRSASYTANAVESPIPPGAPVNNDNDDSLLSITFKETDEYDYFYEKHTNESSNEYNFDSMKEKYENGIRYERKDKYLTLLEEINAESADDDIYLDDELYEDIMVPHNTRSEDFIQAEMLSKSKSKSSSQNEKSNYTAGIAIVSSGSYDSYSNNNFNERITASSSPSVKTKHRHLQEANTPYGKERMTISQCSFSSSPSESLSPSESQSPDRLNMSTVSIEGCEEILHRIKSSYPFSSMEIKQNEEKNNNSVSLDLDNVIEKVKVSFPFSSISPIYNNISLIDLNENDDNISKSDEAEVGNTVRSNGNRVSFREELLSNSSDSCQPTSNKITTNGNKRSPLRHISNNTENKQSTKPSCLKLEYNQSDSFETTENQNSNILNGSDSDSKYATPSTVYSKDVFGSFMKSINSTDSINSRSSYKILNDSKRFNRSIEYTPPQLGLNGELQDTSLTSNSQDISTSVVDSELMDKLFTYLHSGDIISAAKIIDSNDDKINLTESEVNCLFLSFAENIDSFSYPLKTADFLINRLNANVNAVDSKGKTALHHLILNSEIGKLLLSKGADILFDDCLGLCPLSLSFSDESEWLLKEFESSGREKELLKNGSSNELFKYATYLILAGHSKRATSSIKSGKIQITPHDATVLLRSCSGNFENMKEPVETFELLEALGASLDD